MEFVFALALDMKWQGLTTFDQNYMVINVLCILYICLQKSNTVG